MVTTQRLPLTIRGFCLLIGTTFLFQVSLFAQHPAIPAVYSNLETIDGHLSFIFQDTLQFRELSWKPRFTLAEMIGAPKGTKEGLSFEDCEKIAYEAMKAELAELKAENEELRANKVQTPVGFSGEPKQKKSVIRFR